MFRIQHSRGKTISFYSYISIQQSHICFRFVDEKTNSNSFSSCTSATVQIEKTISIEMTMRKCGKDKISQNARTHTFNHTLVQATGRAWRAIISAPARQQIEMFSDWLNGWCEKLFEHQTYQNCVACVCFDVSMSTAIEQRTLQMNSAKILILN